MNSFKTNPTSIDSFSANEALIQMVNIVKVFKTSAGEYLALKGINLSFDRGEFTSIMGKSGSGKSTLINMITGIDHPTSGVVRVGDTEIHRKKEGQLAVWRGRNLGIVFQFFQLLPTLTVLENTMLPMDFCDVYAPAERENKALSLLKLVGIEDHADKLPAALSGGQQQIAAIARALANDPPILIADEPTGNLDSRTAENILAIFNDLAIRGKTILIVTHDPGLAKRSTRRILISDGELINSHVSQALHMLHHSQMLQITRMVTHRVYEPGSAIARQGALDAGLYIITRGQVDVLRNLPRGRTEIVGHLHAGDYFGELEMVESSNCDLLLRSSTNGPVETLCLSLEKFNEFITEAPSAAHILRKAAADRAILLCNTGNRPHKGVL